MDYKNFFLRIPFAFIMILIFSITITKYSNYISLFVYPIYFIILIEIIIFFRKNIIIFFISLIYVLFSLICFKLYLNSFYNSSEFFFIIILVIIFDIFSYIFGSMFGRIKILPSISPKKTLLGLIAGFVAAFSFGYLFNYYYFFDKKLSIIFIFTTIFLAFIGDVLQSFFKRKLKIKDSSKIFLGHGGFFDRFDSLIMVVIWMYFFNLLK